MEITAISREMIKPSTPTPHHCKHLNISLIDQFIPLSHHTRMLLFYSARGDVHRFKNTNMSHRLRSSLSEVLSEFYPLAGRFDNNYSIDCNDDGLEYIEAQVKAPFTLSQLLALPDPKELDQFHPYDARNYGAGFKGLSAVQVTVFDECGSMVIGVSLWHRLADAASIAVFINAWAAITRAEDKHKHKGKGKDVAAIFTSASFFPPRDMPEQQYDDSEGTRKSVVKRFVFTQLKINSLKAKFAYERPTRVEVVSALLLKCMINACKSRSSRSIVPGIAINLRSRMNPPLPANYIGNLILPLIMKPVGSGSELESLNDLGMQLRKLIREIDSDYLAELQAGHALLPFEILEQQTNIRVIGVSSWCRFPFDEADVGWGAPTWAASVNPSWEDCIVLMDAKNGDGIEAWATLDEDDMGLFESDDELLEFACVNPMVCEL